MPAFSSLDPNTGQQLGGGGSGGGQNPPAGGSSAGGGFYSAPPESAAFKPSGAAGPSQAMSQQEFMQRLGQAQAMSRPKNQMQSTWKHPLTIGWGGGSGSNYAA